MANELNASASLSFLKGNVGPASAQQSNKHFSVAGNAFFEGTQSVGFAAVVALNLGGITTPGWFLLQNTDATNFIDIYTATAGVAFLRLKPGEFAMGRFAVAAPAAKADTAAVVLQYLIVEN